MDSKIEILESKIDIQNKRISELMELLGESKEFYKSVISSLYYGPDLRYKEIRKFYNNVLFVIKEDEQIMDKKINDFIRK